METSAAAAWLSVEGRGGGGAGRELLRDGSPGGRDFVDEVEDVDSVRVLDSVFLAGLAGAGPLGITQLSPLTLLSDLTGGA